MLGCHVTAVGLSVADAGAERFVEGADPVAAVLGSDPGGDAEQSEPGRVPGFVAGREVALVVDLRVDHPQRDEPPVHR